MGVLLPQFEGHFGVEELDYVLPSCPALSLQPLLLPLGQVSLLGGMKLLPEGGYRSIDHNSFLEGELPALLHGLCQFHQIFILLAAFLAVRVLPGREECCCGGEGQCEYGLK